MCRLPKEFKRPQPVYVPGNNNKRNYQVNPFLLINLELLSNLSTTACLRSGEHQQEKLSG